MFSSPPEQIDVTPVVGTNEHDSLMGEGKSKLVSVHLLSRGPTMDLLGPPIPIRLQGLILFDGQRRLADFGGN